MSLAVFPTAGDASWHLMCSNGGHPMAFMLNPSHIIFSKDIRRCRCSPTSAFVSALNPLPRSVLGVIDSPSSACVDVQARRRYQQIFGNAAVNLGSWDWSYPGSSGAEGPIAVSGGLAQRYFLHLACAAVWDVYGAPKLPAFMKQTVCSI